MLILWFTVQTAQSLPRTRRHSGVAVRSGASWLSLVAATTKGIGQLGLVRVKIKADARIAGSSLRLVVQSYSAESLKQDELPSTALVPMASLQRSVSQDELRAGIELDVVHVGASTSVADIVVFAWVEAGHPDFKYDAALARPSVGALKGRAVTHERQENCRIAEVFLTAAA
jgi:hypothetical protein